MTLETRKLGSQGPELTTIGFGSWAIVGARRPDHIVSALSASSWHLDDQTLHAIDAAFHTRHAAAVTP